MKKTKLKTVYISSIIFLVVLLIAMPTMSYAIFSYKSENFHNGEELGGYKSTIHYGFEKDGAVDYIISTEKTGVIVTVDIHDPNSLNYIGKFRLKVGFEAYSYSAIRVMVLNIWRQIVGDKEEIPRLLPVKFKINSSFFLDNTRVDQYFYYCETNKYTADSLNAYYYKGKTDYELIQGINQEMDSYEENVSLSLYIRPYMVQSNRWEDHWNLSELPKPL